MGFDLDADRAAWLASPEAQAQLALRTAVREKLFMKLAPAERYPDIAEDWPQTREEAADSFADETWYYRRRLQAIARFRDHQPTPKQLQKQAEEILKRTRDLEEAMASACLSLADMLDDAGDERGDDGEPLFLFGVRWTVGTLQEAASTVVRQIESGQYTAPTIRQLRVKTIAALMRLHRKHFGKYPGVSREGPFLRVLEHLFAAEGVYTTSLYEDAREASKSCRRDGQNASSR